MKTLLILRHAKSSWKHPELADHERPLNKRGQHDAPQLGTLLVDRELLPQLILSSTAVRTRQTAEALVETSHYAGSVEFLDALYMAEPPAYLKALRGLPDDLERVLLIGHNPGLEGLVQLLSGQIVALPTAALAHIVLPIQTWGSLTHETQGELVELFLPKPEEEPAKTEPEPKPKDRKPKEKAEMADKDKDKKKDEKLEKKDKKVKKDKKDKKDKKKDKK
jgi:phosphohistidine phosphatase